MKENACFFLFREPRGWWKRGEGERAARSGARGAEKGRGSLNLA